MIIKPLSGHFGGNVPRWPRGLQNREAGFDSQAVGYKYGGNNGF